ncbi:MAG: hypothetical protein DSM106950_06515 [Stigonema ocellatum SAG 48.90 = DSM 106950]|nr:hypothetical protein [Stigonema ocellatum SAG 48.90 = DSM 106950]
MSVRSFGTGDRCLKMLFCSKKAKNKTLPLKKHGSGEWGVGSGGRGGMGVFVPFIAGGAPPVGRS